MRNKKKLLMEQLDRKLEPFHGLESVIIPDKGWINTIRTSLNMTMSQLGAKMNITRQGLRYLEITEEKGTISIETLRNVGNALDMHFVYGFVPMDGSVEKYVDRKSKKVARNIVMRTHRTMQLEDQGVDNDVLEKSIMELAVEIKREMRRMLWD